MSIDYGIGTTNIDPETGIRFGVISQNSILEAWCAESEAVYPEFEQSETDAGEDFEHDLEPSGYQYIGDGYIMKDCLDSDVMVLKSPFFTFAPYCPPCVPGAGDLDDAEAYEDQEPGKSGEPMVYCVGHDWFDHGLAPYRVFGVISGRECFPDKWYRGY